MTMATIKAAKSQEQLAKHIKALSDEQLIGQELVQQGAIHAVTHLLNDGCSEATARNMLHSLRESADIVRAEAERRGRPAAFDNDKPVFH
jgi:CTP-dependent riboflavin kinase